MGARKGGFSFGKIGEAEAAALLHGAAGLPLADAQASTFNAPRPKAAPRDVFQGLRGGAQQQHIGGINPQLADDIVEQDIM